MDAAVAAGYPDPCPYCDPDAMPAEFRAGTSRTSDDHVAGRFGDGGRVHVRLEHELVDDITSEAIAGDPGVVLVMTGERHDDHVAAVIRRGLVTIERVP